MVMKWMGCGLAVALLSVAAGPAAAEWPNDKAITIVIPYSAGGGFDTIVRSFAPALETILGTQVVPENIPGAGGTKGAATVHRSAPDGYTIGIYNIPGFTVSQVLGEDIGFDLSEVSWIANLETSRYAIAVKADSPIQSMADLCGLGRPAKMSDTGLDSTSSIAARISFALIDCAIVNVTGYEGSNDAMIAVMRGEVDATLKPISSLKKYTDSGDLRLIITYTDGPAVDGVENSTDAGYPQFANFDVRRIIGGPPGMPQDIVDRLSAAFIEAGNSPALKEWAAGAGVELEVVGSEEAAATMRDLSTFYAQYKDILAAK